MNFCLKHRKSAWMNCWGDGDGGSGNSGPGYWNRFGCLWDPWAPWDPYIWELWVWRGLFGSGFFSPVKYRWIRTDPSKTQGFGGVRSDPLVFYRWKIPGSEQTPKILKITKKVKFAFQYSLIPENHAHRKIPLGISGLADWPLRSKLGQPAWLQAARQLLHLAVVYSVPVVEEPGQQSRDAGRNQITTLAGMPYSLTPISVYWNKQLTMEIIKWLVDLQETFSSCESRATSTPEPCSFSTGDGLRWRFFPRCSSSKTLVTSSTV